MKSRWVLTFKDDGRAKARMVLMGFTDPDLLHLRADSPTVSRRGRQLFLQQCANRRWRCEKGDVVGAFLQGREETEAPRAVYTDPVPELRRAMKLRDDEIAQVLKAGYGLTSAPRRWWEQVGRDLRKLGFEPLRTEPCIWVLRGADGQPIGGVCLHVDDFLFAGDGGARWLRARQELLGLYRWTPWESGKFMQTGLEVSQDANFGFTLKMERFCLGVQPIAISRERRLRPELPATPQEVRRMAAIAGSAQWRGTQGAPHILPYVRELHLRKANATVGDVLFANKVVGELHTTATLPMVISRVAGPNCFVGWADASQATDDEGKAVGGYLVTLTAADAMKGAERVFNVISWCCKRLPRVARSSEAAESQALAECQDELDWCRLVWAELQGCPLDLARPELAIRTCPAALVTDATCLYDAVNARESAGLGVRDKRAAIEALRIKENLQTNLTELRWVNSEAQLGDGLTKVRAAWRLARFFRSGQRWRLVFDPARHSARVRAARGIGGLADVTTDLHGQGAGTDREVPSSRSENATIEVLGGPPRVDTSV